MSDLVAIGGARGGGGKGGGGGSARTPQESPDSLRSRQYARIVDLISEGEIEGLVDGLKSVFLDETPVLNEDGSSNFAGVTIVTRTGTQAQEHIPGFSAVENEVVVSAQAKHGAPVVRSMSNANLDAVRVTISIPALTFQDPSTGDLGGSSVTIAIDRQTAGGGWEEVAADTITGKTTSRYQRSYRIALPGTGPWDVRVRRVTEDSAKTNLQNETWWDSYTEIIDAKLRYPNSALVALQVDAEQFRAVPRRSYLIKGLKIRVPSNYNPETRDYYGGWDGTWKIAWSNNPAWVFYDFITSKRYGLGDFIDTEAVDKWGLYEVARYCDQLVPDGFGGMEPRFTCNVCFQERMEAFKVVNNLASVFRGMVFWAQGQLSVVQDRPADVVALFTAANVIDGRFQYSGSSAKARHTVALVTWNDPSDHYRQKIEYVDDEVGIGRYGFNPTEVYALGCTSRGQAHRMGEWILYSEQNETETVSFKAGMDAALVFPGAIIQTQDPYRSGKRYGGRVVSATPVSVTIDAPLTIEPGLTYQISVVLPSGAVATRAIVNGLGETSELALGMHLPEIPLEAAVWVVSASDLVPETWRVVNIAETETGVVEITALAHRQDKFAAIENGLTLEPLPTIAHDVRVPATPTNFTVTETAYSAAPNTLGTKLVLSWSGTTPSYQLSWRRTGEFSTNWQTVNTRSPCYDIENAESGDYTFSVIAINALGRPSAPLNAFYTATLASAPPDDVTALQLVAPWEGTVCDIAWDEVRFAASYLVEVWNGGAVRRATTVRSANFTYSREMILADGGPWRSMIFKVKATKRDGARSENYAELLVSNPQVGLIQNARIVPQATSLWFYYDRPADADFAGVQVWISRDPSFSPSATTLVYDGAEQWVTIAAEASGEPLAPNVTYHVRAAGYDAFGKDNLTLTPALTGRILLADIGIIQGNIRESSLAADLQTKIGTVDTYNARLSGLEQTYGSMESQVSALSGNLSIVEESNRAGEAVVRSLLVLDAARDQERKTKQTVAYLAQDVEVNADELSAEVQNRELQFAQLKTDLSSTAATLQQEQLVRAEEDGALAGAIATLNTTVGSYSASIEQQAISIDGIRAQYTLKMDNNGHVSGFGLSSELIAGEEPVSRAVFNVNQFAVVAPGRTAGQLNSVPIAVLTTPMSINGVAFQPGVYIDGASINQGTIGSAAIGLLQVQDAHIATLSAQKISTGELKAETEIKVGGRLLLHGTGYIESYKTAGYSRDDDYVRLDQGNVQIYRKVPNVGTVRYSFISRIETGVANNNDIVYIPGYWASEPKVSVFPASIGSYSAAYANQSQTLICQALELKEQPPGSMCYQFRARAMLALAAGSNSAAINASSGDLTGSTTWSSPAYSTPSNCASITPTVNLSSIRWLGTGTTYQRRQVIWRVRYIGDGGGGAWRTRDIGAAVSTVSDSYTFSFPAPGAYTFWIEFAASDAAGSFVASSAAYDESTVTYSASGSTLDNTDYGQFTARVAATLPTYTPPPGWVIADVGYSWSFFAQSFYFFGQFAVMPLGQWIGKEGEWSTTYYNHTWSGSGTLASYDTNAYIGITQSFNLSGNFTFSVTANIRIRQFSGASSSGSNRFDFISYNYELSAATVLAAGTLNWLALAE